MPDLAGVAPIYRGRLLAIGQVGSLVRIPQGLVDLVGACQPGEHRRTCRHDAGAGGSEDGMSDGYRCSSWARSIEAPVVFSAASERIQASTIRFTSSRLVQSLVSVFPQPGKNHLRLGRLAAAEDVPVCLDASRFVVRHAAVVGSTGSGKTSAVASLLQNFVRGGWAAANIVVIDPHGEYSSALAGDASVRSVLAEGERQLRVPFWALPAAEIVRIFAGAGGGATFTSRFNELVTAARREFVREASWLDLDESAVTADTPVPFDVRRIWHQLDSENHETRRSKGEAATACRRDPGDAHKLRPAQFEPYGPGGQAPHKGPMYDVYGTMPDLLRLGLLNPQLRFFQEPAGEVNGGDPLVEVMQEWLGKERPISVLDFSGVPVAAADVAIGVILNLLFEVALRSERAGPGIGRPSPVLVVLEEAHRYLGASASILTRESANRITRERGESTVLGSCL